jgi:hypothetical protein
MKKLFISILILLFSSLSFAADYDDDKKADELDGPGSAVSGSTLVVIVDPADADKIVVEDFDTLATSVVIRNGSILVPYLDASDDNFIIPAKHTVSITIATVWCKCQGTCTTPAQISFEDEDGNAMSHGTLTCADVGETPEEGAGSGGLETIDSGGGLGAYESLAFDVDNTPTAGDNYIIGYTFTID